MLVNWYRNASEKDQGIAHGTGEIAHLGWMERTAQGMAIIVDDKGNFVEKELSLIKIAEVPADKSVEYIRLLGEADDTIAKKNAELEEANKVIERLNKKPKAAPKPVTPKKS